MLLVALVLSSTVLTQAGGASDLAAQYYLGEGTGVNWSLDLQPSGSFSFSWDGCGGNYDQQSGFWVVVNGIVELSVVERKPDPPGKSLPHMLRPIRWGRRIYLVAEDELVAFCNSVNDGDEPRSEAYGMTFLRENDWDVPVVGKPDIPAKVREYLLESPVRGRLVSRTSVGKGVVDRGSDQGLRPGMILYSQIEYELLQYRIVSTSASSCQVEGLYSSVEIREGPVSTLLWDESLRPKREAK